MKSTNTGRNINVADIALLTGIGIATIACSRFSNSVDLAQSVLTFGAFELAYLWWVARGLAGADRRRVLGFALRVNAQALVQVVTHLATLIGVAMLLDAMTTEPGAPTPWVYFHSRELVTTFGTALIKISLSFSLGLAWARFHFLRKFGMNLVALADGSYLRKSFAVPAPVHVVNTALAGYLERLTLRATPKYTRMLYESNVTIRHAVEDGADCYTLTWSMCPCRVTIRIEPAGIGAAALEVRFALRQGPYRSELFVNPVDAFNLGNYLQTHVFQALVSEMALSNAVTKQDALRHQAVESQLRILQAQIEPHFLFNTLANVRHLYRSSVDAGEEMMDHLIVYLRSTLEELRSDASTVAKEMDLILHYLAIMKIRMGERLSYGFIVADSLAAHPFPPAMLISLVENSIKHGLHDRADGKLTIACAVEGGYLRMTVSDNGAGFSSVEGTGVGLSNIRQRLDAIYGQRAWLEVGAASGGGFESTVMIPYERME